MISVSYRTITADIALHANPPKRVRCGGAGSLHVAYPDGSTDTITSVAAGESLKMSPSTIYADSTVSKVALLFDGTPPAVFPAILPLSGFWEAPYTGAPIVGVVGGNLTEATNPPTVGVAQNNLAPAEFAGGQILSAPGTVGDQITATAFSFWMLVRLSDVTTAGYLLVDDDGTPADTAQGFDLTVSGGFVTLGLNQDAQTVTRAIAANAYAFITGRFDSINLQIGVNEAPGAAGSAATLATSTPTTISPDAVLKIGNYSGLDFGIFGRVLELATSKSALPDQNFLDAKTRINARYGLAL